MNYHIIIPARGGSKRFPGKNLAILNNKSLLGISIEYALSNNISLSKEQIWVNTDDAKISKEAEKYGVQVFDRSPELGEDHISTGDVLKNQVNFMLKRAMKVDAVILLQATTPLRPNGLIEKATTLFENHNCNSLAGFSPSNKKLGKIINNRFEPQNYTFGQRSQDMTPLFYENGLIYVTKANEILQGKVLTEDVFPMVIDHPFAQVDIDDVLDLYFAENLIKKYGE
ncbi:acylneuraminate cytidylyltransferase family protein [Algoriphagus hitonicola]|uniref:CMP-N-acetylneuraminic acid synthetase n=1 Tax=Algoriphagus hitonicola TaxID=435880 RepID=A0A1I2X3C0_9BACT|nr:acylneuraminate cytidylyltransferase family protein [Algoriphagus hitonicola]SFH07932.1 CMP-N-acetylneuraminic acid synthetase [Algoriphagus hitonicola]